MESIPNNEPWRGYTLDELRVKRLVNLTRIELEQAKIKHMTERFTNRDKPTGLRIPMVRKMVGALDYLDYGFLAYKIGRKLFSVFGRRKK